MLSSMASPAFLRASWTVRQVAHQPLGQQVRRERRVEHDDVAALLRRDEALARACLDVHLIRHERDWLSPSTSSVRPPSLA